MKKYPTSQEETLHANTSEPTVAKSSLVLASWRKTKTRIVYTLIIAAVIFFIVFFLLAILKNFSESSLKHVLGAQTQTTSEINKLRDEIKLLQEKTESNTLALEEIPKLRGDIARLQTEKSDISLLFSTIDISSSPTPPIAGFVTLVSNKWQSVDVHQEKNFSSKIIGQATYGKIYEYLKKENDYYYISLSPSEKGWIHMQFVKEVDSGTLRNP